MTDKINLELSHNQIMRSHHFQWYKQNILSFAESERGEWNKIVITQSKDTAK